MDLRFAPKRSIAVLALAACLGVPEFAAAETTLHAVMQSDLKILDPIWTTAYIVRNYGYMVYDTLFAMDAKGEIQPQMVDKYSVSADKLTWTFTLRDGLLFHDGAPVTAEDCIASIKRWGGRDAVGQTLMTFVKEMKIVDAKTFTIELNTPTGLMLSGLGKPSSNPAFIMPKRVAETPPTEQIKETIGSGPFIFKADEWKPGVKAVFVKNVKYVPRPEPASAMAGGKVVKLDRVEWIVMTDQQTAVNALKAGEIDYIEQPAIDLLPEITKSRDLKLVDGNPMGYQYAFRFNFLHKPFDNAKIRQALLYAFNQEDFLKAVVGDPTYYKECKALFICGTQFASDVGMTDKLESKFQEGARIAEGGRLRRCAGRADAIDRSGDADQSGAGGKIADGKDRHEGRYAVDGLADLGGPAHQERSRRQGGVGRDAHELGRSRHIESGQLGIHKRRLRQGAVRLALR
jgi:peptide/nickel transport system substrate-binding protein